MIFKSDILSQLSILIKNQIAIDARLDRIENKIDGVVDAMISIMSPDDDDDEKLEKKEKIEDDFELNLADYVDDSE